MARAAVLTAVVALIAAAAMADIVRTRVATGWSSPHFPTDQASLMSFLCDSTPGSAEFETCRGQLQGMATGRNAGIQALGERLHSRIIKLAADAVRYAPVLARRADIPDDIKTFATIAHKQVRYAATDAEIVERLLALRKEGVAQQVSRDAGTGDGYPYFGFIPRPLGAAVMGGAASAGVATNCYDSLSISSVWATMNQSITATVTATGQKSLFCTDYLMIGTMGCGVKFDALDGAGTKTYTLPVDVSKISDAEYWFLTHSGVRLMQFNKGWLGLGLDALSTLTLMTGFAANPVSNATLKANFDFLRNYVEVSPRMQPKSKPRTAGMSVVNALNESYIQSGDSLIVVRYDGLDAMIGWGEGYTAGHSTIAMRAPNGTLYVCESTAHDSYWPRNGIQCHEWRTWMELANNAGYNIVLAPLSVEKAAQFNASKAWDFFYKAEGLNYGYLNFLFGWIDQKQDNFPCLPPTYEYCLTSDTVDTIAHIMDSVMQNSPENVFRQALNHRAGTTGQNLPFFDVLRHAWTTQRKSLSDLYQMPEQDAWRYNTTRYGKPAEGRVMVCCVFTCHMWKAAGIFSGIHDEINCGEQTLWDVYSMEIFDTNKVGTHRPQLCKTADPDNQLCQLMGNYTLNAKPDFNTRTLYAHMGQNCSSLAPNYVRAAGC